jgi:hypothetical protein
VLVRIGAVNPSNLFFIDASQPFPHGGSLNSIANSHCMLCWREGMTGCHVQSGLATVTAVVKFTLEQAMKAQRGSRGIALHFP